MAAQFDNTKKPGQTATRTGENARRARIPRRAFLLGLLILGTVIATGSGRSERYVPQDGDIVFQSLRQTELVRMIEGISRSKYSHCGVVFRVNGAWKVIEAYGTVRYTPLETWIAQGRNGRYAVYRLNERYGNRLKEFRRTLESYLRFPYDYKYDLDDKHIYCSELVYKAFERVYGEKLGALERLGDLEWKPFEASIVKFEGGSPPLDRLIITPKSLSRASQLALVRKY